MAINLRKKHMTEAIIPLMESWQNKKNISGSNPIFPGIVLNCFPWQEGVSDLGYKYTTIFPEIQIIWTDYP